MKHRDKPIFEHLVVQCYRDCKSVKQTARIFNVSECKIYKVLVDMNEYDNETARDVAKLFHAGKSPTDISRILHKSNTSVSKYLPYTKSVYNAEQPTENALRIRACRERKGR